MALFDFGNNKNDPNAPSSVQSGTVTGAAVGSLFGPAGAVIGGGIGLALGMGGSGARRRARRKATNASYGFASDVFSYSGETRSQINTEYERNLSLLTASSAARGGTSSEGFAIQKGKMIQERDVAIGAINEEVEAFRKGPNYEWFRRDYERVTSVSQRGNISKDGDDNRTLELGTGSISSRDLRSPYNKQMRSSMAITSAKGKNRTEKKLFMGYASRIKPTIEQYEKLVFGNAKDKASYKEYMTGRIEKANTWYKAESAIMAQEEHQRKREFERTREGRHGGGK